MIRGMLQSYDEAHTVFVEPAQHTLEIDTLEGKFGGIGVRLERDSQGLLRIYPLPDSPSLKAGVLDGDQLFQAGDLVIIKDTPFDQIAFAVCGPVGEKVDIIIGHAPDFAPVKLSIQRAEIALPSVTYNLVPEEPRVGIIHVSVIAATTPDEIKKAILDLTSKQAAYFILDLRDNGGGLVDAGVDTVRMFLKEGVVTEQQFKGAPVESFKVEKVGEFIAIPLVVLVNQNTASAAEIVSGALQAQHRAKLVGTDTYGKDTIQRIFDLKDGSSLHVTSAKWWVPGLTVPLKPDILQADDPNNANAVVMTAVKALLQP
jgi:carboxyl-terminal processing protease